MNNEEIDGLCLNVSDLNDLYGFDITSFKDNKQIFNQTQNLINK